MKLAIILSFICLTIAGCCNRNLNKQPSVSSGNYLVPYDTMAISKVVKEISYFWKLDSLGSNGYRSMVVRYLRTKSYDVDYEFMLTHLGKGISNHFHFKSNEEYLYLLYYTFNTFNMGKEWKDARIADYIIFEFDARTKKLLSIKKGVG